jgi:hypothetical protein
MLRDDLFDSPASERNEQAKDILEHLWKEISHIANGNAQLVGVYNAKESRKS